MKKILTVLSASLTLFTGQAFADGYLQGQLGYSKMNSSTFSGSESDAYGSASGNLDFGNEFLYGLEVGITNFEKHNVLRIGVSWLSLGGDLDAAHVEVTGGDLIDAGSYSLTPAEADDAGMDYGFDMNLYSVNFYYDFPVESAFRPYFGLGIGIADIDKAADQETANRVIVGGNYSLDDKLQLGIKYDYIKMKKISGNDGGSFNHGKVHAVSATLNYKF